MSHARRPFSRANRLLTAREFDFVFADPQRSSSALLTALGRPNALDHPRLGLVVSKKCAKAATQRNRIKRIIRESFRLHQARLGPIDIVVIGKPRMRTTTNAELFADLNRHWANLTRCKKSS